MDPCCLSMYARVCKFGRGSATTVTKPKVHINLKPGSQLQTAVNGCTLNGFTPDFEQGVSHDAHHLTKELWWGCPPPKTSKNPNNLVSSWISQVLNPCKKLYDHQGLKTAVSVQTKNMASIYREFVTTCDQSGLQRPKGLGVIGTTRNGLFCL